MSSDPSRSPNGDLESRVVRLEVSSGHHAEALRDFRDETRGNFHEFRAEARSDSGEVHSDILDVRAEIRGVRVEIRVLTGMLFTVVLGVVALLFKAYGT